MFLNAFNSPPKPTPRLKQASSQKPKIGVKLFSVIAFTTFGGWGEEFRKKYVGYSHAPRWEPPRRTWPLPWGARLGTHLSSEEHTKGRQSTTTRVLVLIPAVARAPRQETHIRLQVSLGFRPRLSPPRRHQGALPRCCCHSMAVLRATVTPRRARRRARSRRSDTNGAARSSTATAAVATGTVRLAPPAPTSAERRSGAGAAAAAAPDSHLSANGTHAPPHAARSGPSARPAKHSPDPLGPEHHPHAVSAVHSLHPPAAAKHGSATPLGAAWTSSRAHVTRSLPPDA
eukprot:scaffold1663_cov134-Isochrysis_galbana.AAC.2